ncbi:Zn-ribbon domain-containing OB-fold protein [Brevibacterium zhoupengii]|uniref:Zn-ribbon domain-containing OB-fold protein n=1 Tax=Brevibacterium zhoupengii TaxID=2898795 RepID=UPI001F090993|nr:Zn-ribbon domain-containing OB-fold protein [Brevibacterium zhoupengii]
MKDEPQAMTANASDAGTTPAIRRPGLVTTPLSQPFWDLANDGEFAIQNCVDCGHRQHYPRNICINCWSENLTWMTAAGTGTVWTFTVVEKPGHPAWAPDTPYVIALVELDEGPRAMTRIVDCPPAEVAVGMAVTLQPTWDEQLEQTLLNFAPAASE